MQYEGLKWSLRWDQAAFIYFLKRINNKKELKINFFNQREHKIVVINSVWKNKQPDLDI